MTEQHDIGKIIEGLRPKPTRLFDQIPMRTRDLLAQARRMQECFADKSVVFIGDYDCTSLAVAAEANMRGTLPKKVLVVDFDERVLNSIERGFRRLGLSELLELHCYNVFNPIPRQYMGEFDHFYANPPYGQLIRGTACGSLFTEVWSSVERREQAL